MRLAALSLVLPCLCPALWRSWHRLPMPTPYSVLPHTPVFQVKGARRLCGRWARSVRRTRYSGTCTCTPRPHYRATVRRRPGVTPTNSGSGLTHTHRALGRPQRECGTIKLLDCPRPACSRLLLVIPSTSSFDSPAYLGHIHKPAPSTTGHHCHCPRECDNSADRHWRRRGC